MKRFRNVVRPPGAETAGMVHVFDPGILCCGILITVRSQCGGHGCASCAYVVEKWAGRVWLQCKLALLCLSSDGRAEAAEETTSCPRKCRQLRWHASPAAGWRDQGHELSYCTWGPLLKAYAVPAGRTYARTADIARACRSKKFKRAMEPRGASLRVYVCDLDP